MKNNTIFIVVDSIYYDKTVSQEYRKSPMPFLEKLRSEGMDFSNMYSQAPYTEAALVSLLCGVDTLKKGGYLKKLYNKETIMETFKSNGYDTFCNCVQPLVYPTYSYQGLTDEYYNICYDFSSLWEYRLSFYSVQFKNDQVDKKTMNVIIDLLEDNFKTWISFFQDLKYNNKKTSFIFKYIDLSELDHNFELLNLEYKKFTNEKLKYTEKLLLEGYEHNLFKIHSYNLSKKMSSENMKKLYYRYKNIIRKMIFLNFKKNIINNKLIFPNGENKKNMIKAYINCVYNRFLYEKIDYKIKSKKAAPSMDTTFEHFENWLVKRQDCNPYFAYIHLDDCHSKEMFYTYDTDDFSKLDEEFLAVENYMKKLPKKYKGSISYDVSLQYADICLNRLYNFLENKKLLDNVNIVICADHGSSYTFDPYRANYVNNVHRENYNIPLVIWNRNMKHKNMSGFYNTKDIPATILDLNNIKIPKEYDGLSALNFAGRDYVILENVNGGCPDYNMRDIFLGLRNNNYLVVMKLNIKKSFEDGTIEYVYDLKKDAKEIYNLNTIIDKSIIVKELSILEKEFKNLKKDAVKNNFVK